MQESRHDTRGGSWAKLRGGEVPPETPRLFAKSLAPSSEPATAPVGEDFMRRVVTRRAHHAAAGVCARAAQVERRDRRAVLRPAGQRAHEEELIDRHVAVKNVAAGERILLL